MLMDDKAADQIPDIADIISARSRIQMKFAQHRFFPTHNSIPDWDVSFG